MEKVIIIDDLYDIPYLSNGRILRDLLWIYDNTRKQMTSSVS